MQKTLEICCYTVESALKAEKAGAHRIELCDNYNEGGTTPSHAAIQQAVTALSIPVNVIVRPRGGDFLYSKDEYEIIKQDVEHIKSLGANGIVIGFLLPNGDIDLQRTQEIVQLAGAMEVTFHRAFDMCNKPILALKQLMTTGISRILTSGARQTAIEGKMLIAQLVNLAGNTITIMPGSGVNHKNLKELIQTTGAHEFHSSAKTFNTTQMTWFNPHISMGGASTVDEYQVISVDTQSIQTMANILNTKA